MINIVSEVVQHPKTTAAGTLAASGANAAIAQSWSFTDPNVIAAIVAMIGTVVATYIAIRKHIREEKEHAFRMQERAENDSKVRH